MECLLVIALLWKKDGSTPRNDLTWTKKMNPLWVSGLKIWKASRTSFEAHLLPLDWRFSFLVSKFWGQEKKRAATVLFLFYLLCMLLVSLTIVHSCFCSYFVNKTHAAFSFLTLWFYTSGWFLIWFLYWLITSVFLSLLKQQYAYCNSPPNLC